MNRRTFILGCLVIPALGAEEEYKEYRELIPLIKKRLWQHFDDFPGECSFDVIESNSKLHPIQGVYKFRWTTKDFSYHTDFEAYVSIGKSGPKVVKIGVRSYLSSPVKETPIPPIEYSESVYWQFLVK